MRDEITIGRQEGNTIRLTERNVSRQHARLLKSNGSIAVEDLQSSNGIKVNGRRIDSSTGLSAGDQITIGDYLLALHMDAVEPIASQPTAAVSAPAGHEARTAMIQMPAEPRPPARLVMLSPPAPGAEFALSKERLRIGRAEDSTRGSIIGRSPGSMRKSFARARSFGSVTSEVQTGSVSMARTFSDPPCDAAT